ncbi:MAG: CPBP family glutamic-type intramembrane protease [Betaproteobacteria bacterium]
MGVLLLPIGAALRSILFAPLVEEAVFRLGVQDALSMRLPARQVRFAPALTALAFASLHLLLAPSVRAWPLAAATALPAWWIGVLYERHRRLAPCVAWHAAFNLAWLGGLCAVVPALAEP